MLRYSNMHAAEIQNSTFFHAPLDFFSIIWYHNLLRCELALALQVAKTPIYHVMCRFPLLLHYVIHNLPEWMEVMLSA